ncbi:MAG: EAL domain-containing protein [Cloacibacillus porcorum]|nr:EAL domain-containing protein [Cloacibacillus porcorum]
MRWKHPKLGFVSPAAIIPVCEKNCLISRLDQLVFEEVCRTLAEWKESGIPLLPISVNISRQQLKNPSFFNDYRKITEEAGVARGLIEFELTESLMLVGNDFKNAREVIEEIHSAGFTCSLDDFGSGYSSLGLLKDLKIDCLKLDRMFFANRFETPETRAIIESIIILAKKRNIATVAEGVEYKEQVELLRTIGCDLIQGFYFFRPVPVREFERIVLEEAGKPPTTD